MKSRWIKLATFALATLLPVLANSGGNPANPNPPLKRTGAAADGGLSCTACHTGGGAANSDTRGRLTVQTGRYTPGVPQWVLVHIDHPEARRWGFQLTARSAADPTKQAGTFRVNPDVQVKCDDGSVRGSAAPCEGKLEFAMHTAASTRNGTTGGVDWWVEWTPPATDSGDVIFYAAGNAADGSGSTAGFDRVYTTSARSTSVFGGSQMTSIPFRAVLSPANEVPAVTGLNASGFATVWLHILRDTNGNITSGSVDFNVRYNFPGDATFTGLHIHRGAAGANGGVTVDSGVSAGSPVQGTGRGEIRRQGQVLTTSDAGLATLRDMLGNPEAFYVNLHTSANPAGAIRGQLQRADALVLMTQLSPENEVPAISGLNARGTGALTLLAGRDSTGRITSAEATFDVNYTGFPADTTLTGMHIHTGAAGVNGGVVINSGLASTAAPSTGGGNLRFEVDADMSNAATAAAVNGLFTNPSAYYLNLHTTVNPGGAIRGQMRNTDRITFPLQLSGANEVPAVTRAGASAPAAFTANILRNDDGWAMAASVAFDVNYRFPGAIRFTGMHIHTGSAGVNGGVVINSGLSSTSPVDSTTGFGNIYYTATIDSQAGVNALNGLVAHPESYYFNLHSTDNPGGEVRAQLAAPITALPRITAVINAVSDPTVDGVAQGGLITIFGSNLSKVFSTMDGMPAGSLPTVFNGTTVTIGGIRSPMMTVATDNALIPTDYIVAQVPFEAPAGNHPVAVSNSNGAGNAVSTRVSTSQPSVYFDTDGVIAFRANQSLVRTSAPAEAGENIMILATGLGQTTPALTTGRAATSDANRVSGVTVLFGDQSVAATSAYAVPGAAGAYFVNVRVPANAGTGRVPVAVRVGTATSNRAPLSLK